MSTTAARQPALRKRHVLDRARVLQTALRYVDEHGLEALSMHKLGAELGVRGMSLYGHVDSKDGLLDGMVEVMWSEVEAELPAIDDWQDSVRALATSLRDVVRRHPHAAPLMMTRQKIPENALRVLDTHLRAMRESGVPEECAVALLRTATGYGLGYTLSEVSHQTGSEGDEDQVQMVRRVSAMIPSSAPDQLLRTAIMICGQQDDTSRFGMGVELLIHGAKLYISENGTS